MKKYLFLVIFMITANLLSGGTWEKIYQFENDIIVRKILPVTSNLIFIVGTDGTLAKSTNAGETWTEINGFSSSSYVFHLRDISFANDNVGYLYGTKSDIPYTESTEHIFKTIDGGETWNEVTTNEDFDNKALFLAGGIYAISENLIYAGGGKDTNLATSEPFVSVLIKSQDGGANWAEVNIPEGIAVHHVRFRNENNGYIQIVNRLYSTNDGGNSWNEVSTPFDSSQSHSFAGFGFRLAGENLFIGGGTGFNFRNYMSNDGGVTWNDITPNLNNFVVIEYWNPLWLDENIGWAWNWSEMIKTNDGGQNWDISADRESIIDDIGHDLPSWDYFSFSSNSTGYVAAGKYILKTTNNDVPTNVEKEFENVPTEFTLSQNYPNPFNPSTTISFSIPQQTNVSLKVYDVLGREVAELINKEMSTGSYKVDFDASNLSSGIYVYKITAGTYRNAKKMLLIK